MVVAPKTTAPFICLCIDLTRVNNYLKYGHYPIPNVRHMIEESQEFNCFIDAGKKHGFHSYVLDEGSRDRLTVTFDQINA